MRIKGQTGNSNSGFTLVELIIVVAVISVLTAILAPQYIKYIEKAKVATDMDTASIIQSAIITLCADAAITNDNAAYVTWDTDSGLTGEGKDAVEAVIGIVPAAKSVKARATNVVYSIDFNAEGTPIVSSSVDYTTWDD